jgi:hypothetical protein
MISWTTTGNLNSIAFTRKICKRGASLQIRLLLLPISKTSNQAQDRLRFG